MRCAVMWSGGKDSALAAHRARRAGLEIACLVNFYDEATGRVRFHATRTELIDDLASWVWGWIAPVEVSAD